jgi:hypothetical protein
MSAYTAADYEAARVECREAQARVRKAELAKPLRQSLDEIHALFACPSRRTERLSSNGHSVRLEGHADADLKARIARVRREYKPIPIGTESSLQRASNGWTRVDHDAWGARLEPGVRWQGGNCLMSTIAHLIGANDITTVPDNTDLVGNADWLPLYNERLGRIGYRIEQITAELGLASRKSWIAVLDDGSADHAVAATGRYVRFDPAGVEQGGLPIARLKYGLTLTPTRRRIHAWSPA